MIGVEFSVINEYNCIISYHIIDLRDFVIFLLQNEFTLIGIHFIITDI